MSLNIYTVYKHPSDYPEEYVVRRFTMKDGSYVPDEEIFFKSKFLGDLSEKMKRLDLYFLQRDDNDDPCIVGVYL